MAVVQFDIDGVLANFLAGYRQVQTFLGQAPTRGNRWDDYWDRDVWNVIKQDSFFWESLPEQATRDEFKRIERMQDQHDIYFVTSRPGLYPKRQTEHWLMSQGISRPTVILTSRKGQFAEAVGVTHSIEDKAGNATYVAYQSPKTQSFLLNRPYNQFDQNVLGSKVVRVDSVSEFLDQVEGA